MAKLSIPAVVWALACVTSLMAATPEARMSFLDNGVIRIGVNLNAGGAITYLSLSGSQTNLVNNWDWGRQIQMSHYSGPVPFKPGGKEPAPHWLGLGWNPVQAGDHFRNASRILAHENDGKTLYIKCVPMQYALDNVPAECTFECWISLEGSSAQVRSRMVVDRPDRTQYPARDQELPAVYTIGTLYRLMTYSGDKPFTNGPLSRIEKSEEEKKRGGWPWVRYRATENWAALVDDSGFGVGLWKPDCYSFVGGFAGQPGRGGTYDDPTGYLSPMLVEIIDHNISYEYRYELIVGSLEQIRKHVYDRAPRPAPPTYRFEKDRQHWFYRHAADTGWPIRGELNVLLHDDDPQIIGPAAFWLATDAPKLRIEAAFKTAEQHARVWWKRFDDDRFTETRSRSFRIEPDGNYRVYEVDLAESPEYRDVITGLRLDPGERGGEGRWVKIRSIILGK